MSQEAAERPNQPIETLFDLASMNATKQSIERALHDQRPVLYHLNADTSWLLQVPRPRTDRANTGRFWFNILIDPWLSGTQSDVASWFSTQTHAIPPRYDSIQAVEKLAQDNEKLASAYLAAESFDRESFIDAVAISHEYTDHCHKQTLLELKSNTPIFATTQAAKLIRSWEHFEVVVEPAHFGPRSSNWTQLVGPAIPDWLTIARVVTEGDAQYYHSALFIVFDSQNEDKSTAQAIVYSPHGINAHDLAVVAKAEPPIDTLAFLHGLHSISLLTKKLNLGAYNGLQAQRLLNSRYWIGTHDEVKKGAGLVSWFLRRKVLTLEDAMREEQKAAEEQGAETVSLDDVKFMDLANGQFAVLA